MPKYLTLKQNTAFETIKKYIDSKGYAPSLSELKELLNVKTKRSVVQYLESLEEKGYILKSSQPRGIRLVEDNLEFFAQIPILGYANAGDPMVFAEEENIGMLQVEKNLLPRNGKLFALKISGDSMNQREVGNVNLKNNNFAIVSKESEVRDGDVVLAIIDNAATIKTIKHSPNQIVLYPESDNPIHQPIFLSHGANALINGKVIGALENPIN